MWETFVLDIEAMLWGDRNCIYSTDPRVCYKSGKPKSTKPPALPPAAVTPQEISQQAAAAGEAEGKRIRRRRGRGASRLTRPELATVPATVARPGLATTLG